MAKDRLCVLIRVDGEDHVLGAPGISSSSGMSQFLAIIEILDKLKIADYIHFVCFDTTGSNTGKLKGAIYR